MAQPDDDRGGQDPGDGLGIRLDDRLVHSIQATREAKVTVHGKQYSGIPVETCTTCHDRGKRIGVSFQGLMEIPYTSPYTEAGKGQPALHTKHYLAMHQDLHYGKGMTCQDCHSSLDVHSDGFLAAANLGSVQIECSDCHGTPEAYPWEMPLAPGCQPSVTVIGPDGDPIIVNHIFRTLPGSEGSGPEGQLGLDISPTQPHTTTKQARSCESCHQEIPDRSLAVSLLHHVAKPDEPYSCPVGLSTTPATLTL